MNILHLPWIEMFTVILLVPVNYEHQFATLVLLINLLFNYCTWHVSCACW